MNIQTERVMEISTVKDTFCQIYTTGIVEIG
jgi:hypothetical protein